MTEIDTARIRAAYWADDQDSADFVSDHVLHLCDAADAARAELKASRKSWEKDWRIAQDRAEAAEARVNAALAWEEDCDYHTEMQIITWIERRLLGEPE